MRQFLFTGLPSKGQPVDGRLLLSFGSQRTTAGAAMGCVFPRYVALSITSNDWAPTRAADKETLAVNLQTLRDSIWQKATGINNFIVVFRNDQKENGVFKKTQCAALKGLLVGHAWKNKTM